MLKLAPETRQEPPRAASPKPPKLTVLRGKRRASSMRVARILIRRSLSVLGLGFALLVSGCGGSATDPVSPNIYRGAWQGTWQSVTANDNGTMAFTVFSDGSFTGTMSRKPGLTGNFEGHINPLGQLTGVAGFGADGNFLIQGSVVLNNNNLLGSFRYEWLGIEYNASFTCTPVSGG